jgi:hypothetical protein
MYRRMGSRDIIIPLPKASSDSGERKIEILAPQVIQVKPIYDFTMQGGCVACHAPGKKPS